MSSKSTSLPAAGGTDFLAGGGEMGARMRANDWSTSPLGPPEAWPPSLRAVVALMINSRYPMFVAWGPELAFLYNDGYTPIFGAKHPHTLGLPFRQVWPEIWDDIKPLIDRALAGEPTFNEDLHLVMERNGYPEDTWYSFSYSPLRDESGQVAGMFCACTETTQKVLAERRIKAEADRLAQMFEQAPGFMAMLAGPEHRFELVNPAYMRVVGDREVLGKTVAEALPDAAAQGYVELLDQVYRSGKAYSSTGAKYAVEVTAGGPIDERYVDFVYQPITNAAGSVTGIFVEGYDVTERKLAEAALSESEVRFRVAVDAARMGVWEYQPSSSGLIWDARCTQLFGMTPGTQPSYKQFLAALHLDDRKPMIACIARATAPDGPGRDELEFRSIGIVDRVDRVLKIMGQAEFRNGVCTRFSGVLFDITEQKRAEAALRESEERYRTLFDSIDAGFCIIEMMFDQSGRPHDYRFLEVNPAFERQTGLQDAAGHRVREFVPNHEDHWFAIYGEVALNGGTVRFENGSAALGRWFDVHAFRVGMPEQRRVAVLFNDITKRRAAEEALRDLNETLERRIEEALVERKVLADIVEGTDAFVQVVDLNYRWLAINKAAVDEFARVYSLRPRIGDSLLDLLALLPSQQAAAKAAWDRAINGEAFTTVVAVEDPNQDRRHYEMRFNVLRNARGESIGAFQFVYDVTDRVRDQERLRQAEDLLRQAQKMESIGQLTGGVAHDFNNLLAVISGGLQLIDRQRDPERRQRIFDSMHHAVERGAGLTRQLLAFSRRQPVNPEPIDLARQVDGMRELLDRSLIGGVRVEVAIEPGIWPVEVDVGELELAILNLCVNARDAMPDGGQITVAAENARQLKSDGLAGDFVRLSVSDEGTGMPPDIRARAFEPFFTTKEVGKGSGLGLAQVYGFAKASGGRVAIEGRAGGGTTVTVLLPRSAKQPVLADKTVKPDDSELTRDGALRGQVLLVEDDAEVAALAVEMLDNMGLDVTHVSSAAAALGALANGRAIDIIFSDITMPGGMSGLDLAREVKRRHPNLPIILTTGYEGAAAGAQAEGIGLLLKPYRSETLAETIRAHLTRGPARSTRSRT